MTTTGAVVGAVVVGRAVAVVGRRSGALLWVRLGASLHHSPSRHARVPCLTLFRRLGASGKAKVRFVGAALLPVALPAHNVLRCVCGVWSDWRREAGGARQDTLVLLLLLSFKAARVRIDCEAAHVPRGGAPLLGNPRPVLWPSVVAGS